MSNILLAFYNAIDDPQNPDAMPMFYESFIDGLDRGGNTVWVMKHHLFGFEFGKIPEQSIASIKSFHPDLCIFFNNAFYDVSDIVDCPIVIYEADSPRYYSNKDLIKKTPDRYLYLTGGTSHVKILREEFGAPESHIFIMPFFSELHHEQLPVESNISFIGSKFLSQTETNPLSEFVLQNPSPEEIALYKSCIELLKKNPQLSNQELIQTFSITSKKIIQHLQTDYLTSVLSDERRIGVLSAIESLGLRIYGTENWGSSYFGNHALNLCFINKNVYSLEHNQHILNSSKIGINVGHLQCVCGFSWRVADILASNACLVTDYYTDFPHYFSGLSLPVYHSYAEARELCQTLLSDEAHRKELVLQCNEFIDKNYRFVHLLRLIESILHMNLGSEKLR